MQLHPPAAAGHDLPDVRGESAAGDHGNRWCEGCRVSRGTAAIDEAVVEIAAVGEFDIPHLLEQRNGTGSLSQAEQRHLRSLTRDVSRAHDAQQGQPRYEA